MTNAPATATETNEANDDPDNDPIVLPQLKYGYRKTPMAWAELQEIFHRPNDDGLFQGNDNPTNTDTDSIDLARLCRNEAQQYEYQVYKRQLQRTWRSMVDLIRCTKFGRPSVLGPDGRRYCQDSDDKSPEKKEVETALVLNDFPYCFTADIQHWVLWKMHGGNITRAEIQQAQHDIRERFMKDGNQGLPEKQYLAVKEQNDAQENPNSDHFVFEFLHWINPPHLQSLP